MSCNIYKRLRVVDIFGFIKNIGCNIYYKRVVISTILFI